MRRSTVLLVAVLAVWTQAANSLVNGGFENGMEGWKNNGGEVSPESYQGELACTIRQTTPRWSNVSQSVLVPEGAKSVNASGWLRSDSVRGGKENWERGRISLEFHDAEGDTVGGYPPAVGQVRGRQAWTRVSRSYPIPVGAKSVALECALANSTGTLYCDDLVLEFVQ
mgnify:CR=1 FL=1